MNSSPEPTTSSISPPLAGRYQIIRQLGEGGMGTVYLARDLHLDRHVAVKVLPPRVVNDSGAVARFQREARALAKLSHPGIVQAHDSGQDGEKHFLIMEYVEGQNVAELAQARGKLPPGRAADFVHQTALALHHAHAAGLVHRDVKPGNLLLTSTGEVKLLDLGLARFLRDQVADPSRTREGVGMGTPDYAAPEQFSDAHRADARSDVYSLGCTLYRLLTGEVPFPGSSLSEKYQAHESREPVPVEELCPDVPAGLALVVRKMMAKRPTDRFASAREAAEALSPYVAGSSASFQSFVATTRWERGQLTTPTIRTRRRSVVLVAGIVGLIALAAGAGWALRGERRAPVISKGDENVEGKEPTEQESEKEDPNLLTVAKTGKARFRTINEALDAARPGVTIQVVDDSTYDEFLVVNQPSRHANVTLEATRGARIRGESTLQEVANLITIQDVPRFTLRGFRLDGSATKRPGALVFVRGTCPGVRLERLDLIGPPGLLYHGIDVLHTPSPDSDAQPVIVHGCTFRKVLRGIVVIGIEPKTKASVPTSSVMVHENQFDAVGVGVNVLGACSVVLVAGNRITGANIVGMQVEHRFAQTKDVWFANNTCFECAFGFRLWDEATQDRKVRAFGKAENVRVSNNLILASTIMDAGFIDSGGDALKGRGAGDGESLSALWRFEGNWREHKRPDGEGQLDSAWIPPSKMDVRKGQITGINRDRVSPDYLRPDKGTDPLTKGAGNTDPALPRYVGALPAADDKPWDWATTWKALVESSKAK